MYAATVTSPTASYSRGSTGRTTTSADIAAPYTEVVGRTYKADAVVLRSLRFGEADRVLHLYTAERGRVNAIAKGVRKTTSRFGARLEPLTHAALMLHEGRGELHTVTGADIVHAHDAVRGDPHRVAVGLIG